MQSFTKKKSKDLLGMVFAAYLSSLHCLLSRAGSEFPECMFFSSVNTEPGSPLGTSLGLYVIVSLLAGKTQGLRAISWSPRTEHKLC